MKPDNRFTSLSPEFWANVKFISQKLGYTTKGGASIYAPGASAIATAYKGLGLNDRNIWDAGAATPLGESLESYFRHRADCLDAFARTNLMDAVAAQKEFHSLKMTLNPTCPLPMNKQSGEKKTHAFFTCIINMLIESELGSRTCNYDPRELPVFFAANFPSFTMSRRVDGAFPDATNPLAIWEIKEYYYTTTFGSRVADGVYESLLDGYELLQASGAGHSAKHYLMIDGYLTWWAMGKSYLCRICDMLHMGFIDEVFFGREVISALPKAVRTW